MRNNAGEKVRRIIEEEFDSRVEMAVISYILDKGIENLKEITEEEITKIKGNAFMTDRFCQALVRAAVRISKECNTYDDILPFIVNYLYVPKAKMKEVEFEQDQMTKWKWKEFVDDLDIDYEEDADEVTYLVLNANVIEVEMKEK